MHTVVTGATGLLGGNLAIALLEAGHTVRATRRGSSKAAHLADFAIDWVEADLGDPEALTRAFQGADAVFHCAAAVSIRKRPTPTLMAANVEGTRHVIAAVRQAGVKRLVHTSTVGAVGLSEDGQPCDETQRWNFDQQGMADGYVTTKHLAEEEVLGAAAEGLDVVIINPSYMFGPYDARPSSGAMIIEVVRGRVPGWTLGINNVVDVRDVARGTIAAWQRGKAGERYILSGEEVTYKALFERIAEIAGTRPPSWGVPRWATRLFGQAGDIQEWMSGGEPLINSVAAGYANCVTFRFRHDKATRELGYAPGPIELAIRDAITWFRKQGMLPPA